MLNLILKHTEANAAIVSIKDDLDIFAPSHRTFNDPQKTVRAFRANIKLAFENHQRVVYREDPSGVDYIYKPIVFPAGKRGLFGGLGLFITREREIFSLFDIYLVEKFVKLLDTFVLANIEAG